MTLFFAIFSGKYLEVCLNSIDACTINPDATEIRMVLCWVEVLSGEPFLKSSLFGH